ncbi:hypothetical protein BST61_g11227 [Cercospora zeina]
MYNLVRFLETIPSNKGTSRLAEAYRFVRSLMDAPDPWAAVARAYDEELDPPIQREEVYDAFGGDLVKLWKHFDLRLSQWRWDSLVVEHMKSKEYTERRAKELEEGRKKKKKKKKNNNNNNKKSKNQKEEKDDS